MTSFRVKKSDNFNSLRIWAIPAVANGGDTMILNKLKQLILKAPGKALALAGQTRGSQVRKIHPKRSHILGRLRAIRTVISSHFTGHQAPNQGVLAP